MTVARAEEVPPGSVTPIQVGDLELALARIGDSFYATQGRCIHLKGPLGHGRLDGHVLSCPWHGWQFDVRDGLNEFDHALGLETFPVRVEDGDVKVELPPRP